MATDYSKKKNAELEDLLRARSLPHTGKKADLIARLVQHDKDSSQPAPTTSAKSSTATAVADDEIDWDDEKEKDDENDKDATPAAAPEPTPAGKAALAAGGKGQPANPVAVPNQVLAEDPATTDDLTVKQPSTTTPTNPEAPTTTTEIETDDTPAPAASFSQNLAQTSLDAELEKRKARAARFGLPAPDDSDAVKALERAKKFGTETEEGKKVVVGGLNSALPERAARKRGRGEVDRSAEEEKGAKRQDSRRRDGRGRGRSARGGGRGGGSKGAGEGGKGRAAEGKAGKKEEKKEEGPKVVTSVVSEKDRAAAEARKKRFAAAA
ncbi:hypothetical protein MMC30_000319 [Trapelia coarctata]|nr:hypothetical protein [Trapelia coarctata]